ncbi:MAG: peptide ABC transporter substrate-binding protein [Nitrospinae bacterium CG11_big_fil_rev_8_21_14_0_20_45_15]|nr:MAG: peptide ABC transporter substrate-binding protein [Nitrospinae bacterium CG11_big_fil_rev_8_21_14_0_20_45_15]
MIVKRILILAPTVLILILLQSYLWVPTYNNQGLSNPARLAQFVNGSAGDAQVLNPILSADTASSEVNELVFDSLVDLDNELNYRPRLASSWTQYELSYLIINLDEKIFPHERLPADWMKWLRDRVTDNARWLENIDSIKLLPEFSTEGSVSIGKDDKGKDQFVTYQLRHPQCLEFKLKKIDQDFFLPLRDKLGADYFSNFPFEKYVHAKNPSEQELLKKHWEEILPLTVHNPVLEFELRRGVKFHDGHEFDSGDVLFTYRALMDPASTSPRQSDYEPIKEASILGPYKIRFVYKRLFSTAINSWAIGILPEHLLNKSALEKEAGLLGKSTDAFSIRDSGFNRNPVGTGPFIFKEWKSDQFIRLVRNPQYWDGLPEYEEYITRIIPDTLTQEMEFYSGAVDNYSVQPHQVARLSKDPQYQHFSSPGYFYSYIGYNLRNPLFKSRDIRRALGMAIDVKKIIQYVLYGEGEAVTGPYPKITDWYDFDVKALPYDPEGALRIFEQEGWKKNNDGYLEKDGKIFEFNLITNNGNPIRKSILAITQNSWKKIGVKCNTQLFEWAVFLKDFVNSLKFDALVLGWSMGADPDLYQIWHSSQTEPGRLNFVGYQNEEVDRLIVRLRKEYDKNKQMIMTKELHRLIANDQPYTFLYTRKSSRLLDKKIVLVERDERGNEIYKKIYPTRDGRLNYYFNKWRKLNTVPEFNSQG